MKFFLISVLTFVISLVTVGPVIAVEKLVFDSTDHYLGGCQLTNKSSWELKEDLQVSKFQVWYNWNQGETTLPVKVFFKGEKFAEFEATRASCDPYQKQWCNADYQINKLFPKGGYSTEIPNARQCLKPGGTGAIRLYIDEVIEKTVEATPAASPEVKMVVPKNEAVLPKPTVSPAPVVTCSCPQTTIIATTVGLSVLSSFIVTLLLKKFT